MCVCGVDYGMQKRFSYETFGVKVKSGRIGTFDGWAD